MVLRRNTCQLSPNLVIGVRFLVNYGKSLSVTWHWGFRVEIEVH